MLNKKYNLNTVREYIESFSYKLLSTEYINARSKLKLKCPSEHIYNVKWPDFKNNHRCPECALVKGWSKPEKEIAEYVKTIYLNNIIENDRTQIKNYWTNKNLELDIWLPEIRKAIEFNGSYWHNNDKSKWYDEMKKKQCIQKGIDLLVINEQDWYDDKKLQLNNIGGFINV